MMLNPRWMVVVPMDDKAPGIGQDVEASTDLSVDAQIIEPPSGLGIPGMVTEDTSFPRGDGVQHFEDWYEPRILTWANVMVGSTVPCSDLGAVAKSTRAFKAVELVKRAWRRRQQDIEIWMTINGEGPYAVVGRPRVAEVDWLEGYRDLASMMLRFDCVDHRMYLLDLDPTTGAVVGDGWRDTDVVLTQPESGRTYGRIYGVVRDHAPTLEMAYGLDESGLSLASNPGNLPAQPIVTFHGDLERPVIENLTTGQTLTLKVNVPAGTSQRVTVDTGAGEVTLGGSTRYGWLVESPKDFLLEPGENYLRLTDASSGASLGRASVRWRSANV